MEDQKEDKPKLNDINRIRDMLMGNYVQNRAIIHLLGRAVAKLENVDRESLFNELTEKMDKWTDELYDEMSNS